MTYLTGQLRKVGIEANTPATVIEEALKIDSGAALQTAIGISLTGISWVIKGQGHDPETANKLRSEYINAFLQEPNVIKARLRLKQIMHEGC